VCVAVGSCCQTAAMGGERRLPGGVANAGAVTRRGDLVLRPATRFTASSQRFLARLRAVGFDGAPEPRGVGADGCERLAYIDGEVAIPPYRRCAQSDSALASLVTLLRRCHDAAAHVGVEGEWNPEGADPAGGPIICHNDVCLENVVFRGGAAVALLDWEFAAPGRPVYDLAQMARLCIPVDDDQSAARLGWMPSDRPFRARLICDAYGLSAADRRQFLVELDAAIERHTAWVLRRVEQGDRNVIAMWNAGGGAERYDKRRAWWSAARRQFETALD
jgi:aminoglycoside phosphotransferase (APT) family kinase protein